MGLSFRHGKSLHVQGIRIPDTGRQESGHGQPGSPEIVRREVLSPGSQA